MSTATIPPDVYTFDEAAQWLRVSKAMVKALVEEAEIRTFRIGRRCVRIHREDLEAYIAKQRGRGTA